MQNANKFSKVAKALVAGLIVAGGLVATSLPSSATTTPPTTMDSILIGSGSDTTYDMMKAIDKVYAGANGCATIWYTGETQPFDGSCSSNDLASGNGTDKTNYAWVNDGHTVISQRYPVGSGNGVKELCYQGKSGVRNVNFARSSSSSSTSCSDLTYVGYAKDAVSWYHATKDASGNATTSAAVADISKADLKKIYDGTYTKWSDLNGLAKNAAGELVTGLSDNLIKVYTAQTGSGTVDYWKSNIVAAKSGALTTGQENAPVAIFDDGNEADAIYFMSYGRYKQAARITGTPDAYFGNAVSSKYPLAADSLGKIDGVAPTNESLVASSGAFPLARTVYNVTRFPSAETTKYVGATGFLCSTTIGAIKDRISGKTYRSLIEEAILSEGFVPLPVGSTGGGNAGTSHCRVSLSGNPAADVTAPSVGVDTGATYSGLASATFVFGEPVRGINVANFTAQGSVVTNTTATSGVFKSAVNGALPVTVTCYNQKSAVVANCDSASNATDPHQVQSVLKVKVTSTAVANSVVFSAAAAAGTDLAGNTSAAFTTKATTLADLSAGVSYKGAWANNAETVATKAKTYTVYGANITIALTGGAYIYIDGVQVYNPSRVINNAAVPAVLNTNGSVKYAAKAAYKSYGTTGKIFTTGTFDLGASSATTAGGTATTRTNPIALSTKSTWGGSGWHTVKVVVQAGPTAVTALSAS